MRGHEHEVDAALTVRPAAARHSDVAHARAVQAAAAGRTDVLAARTVLALQRTAGNAAVAGLLEEERSPVHDVIGSGGGRPLEPGVRAEMEARLGHDFSDVRVHDDSRAHESARAVDAHAYTVGTDVVFQRDRYDPSSTEGKTALAHELTHVVQQRSGPVDGTPAAGGISVSDPSDRFEREAAATAEAAVARPLPAPGVHRDGAGEGGPAPASVQRAAAAEEEVEEEQAVLRTSVQGGPEQGASVQRDSEEPELEEP